jgi:hypothetical protein
MERRYIHEHSDAFGKKTGACIKRAKKLLSTLFEKARTVKTRPVK